jgi:hypothetical protein
MLIEASIGAMAVEDAVAVPGDHEAGMEVVSIGEDTANKDQVAAANATTNMFGFWWGLPYPWWPTNFCAWDYWTSAAWTVTISGTCTGGSGRALAGMARQAMTTNANIRRLLRGSVGPVSTTSVLCAQAGTRTATYTIRLSASRATLTALRQPTATSTMRSVFTRQSLARTAGGSTFLGGSTQCAALHVCAAVNVLRPGGQSLFSLTEHAINLVHTEPE